MKKGISTIIAVILMLIITIALVGTAYMFISGMMGARMSQMISADISCVDGKIILVVYNQGTDTIDNMGSPKDLKIYVDNTDSTNTFEDGETDLTTYSINPRESKVLISQNTYSDKKSIMIITSSNSQTGDVFC